MCSDHPRWLLWVSEFVEPAIQASPALVRLSMWLPFRPPGAWYTDVLDAEREVALARGVCLLVLLVLLDFKSLPFGMEQDRHVIKWTSA